MCVFPPLLLVPHSCRAACWFDGAPANISFAQQCFCRVDQTWLPTVSDQATPRDSAQLLWPCQSDRDCSWNGKCSSTSSTSGSSLAGGGGGGSSTGCVCDAAWQGPTCSELALQPVDRAQLGYQYVFCCVLVVDSARLTVPASGLEAPELFALIEPDLPPRIHTHTPHTHTHTHTAHAHTHSLNHARAHTHAHTHAPTHAPTHPLTHPPTHPPPPSPDTHTHPPHTHTHARTRQHATGVRANE
jgi:hypothetical protein